MTTLHIISSSAADSAALTRCLHCASAGDTVLFIGNGVYSGNTAAFMRITARNHDLTWLALRGDVETRGCNHRLAANIELVDDAQFVDLVVAHQPIVSWSA